MDNLSRTAQLVALGLFGFGGCSSVGFKTPKRIGRECKAGLDELVAAGLITLQQSKRDGYQYEAVRGKMEMPMRKFKAMKESESFPVVTDDKEKQWGGE